MRISSQNPRRSDRSFAAMTEALFADPRVSHWLKRSLAEALGRDPVAAVEDTQLLLEILTEKLDFAPRVAESRIG